MMPRVKCWQVDAFTDRPFRGNPAAVCSLEHDAPDDWMQAVAAEMNLAETAFVQRREEGFSLRWFTPAVEVDLCGHATLATAHVLWTAAIAGNGEPLRFHTRSGVLTCTRAGEFIEMDFPALPASAASPHNGLLEALGVKAPQFAGRSKFDYILLLDSPDEVRSLRPDFRKLAEVATRGVIVTARSDDPQFDFISRFFAPAAGIDEDPVCGSAHCCLTHFWANRLGKQALMAFQASARSGILRLRLDGDRVILGGQAVTVWEGELLRSFFLNDGAFGSGAMRNAWLMLLSVSSHLSSLRKYGRSVGRSSPASVNISDEGTGWNEFIELNPLALADWLPRNSQRRSIAVACWLNCPGQCGHDFSAHLGETCYRSTAQGEYQHGDE
jgi:PhzF family phenazine biosynthesis protein